MKAEQGYRKNLYTLHTFSDKQEHLNTTENRLFGYLFPNYLVMFVLTLVNIFHKYYY